MWKPKTPEEFIAENAPRHEPMEQWKQLAKQRNKADVARLFSPVFSGTVPPQEGPKTLIDMYLRGDARQIWQDARLRPKHYDARQHELLAHLMGQGQLVTPATERELNELFLTWQRSTEQDEKLRKLNTEITKSRNDDGDIILEDGRSLEQANKDSQHRATYEAQDFDDKILI